MAREVQDETRASAAGQRARCSSDVLTIRQGAYDAPTRVSMADAEIPRAVMCVCVCVPSSHQATAMVVVCACFRLVRQPLMIL